MNETLNSINETLNRLASYFVCFHVDKGREANVVTSLLDVENKLELIHNECSGIRNVLERIADSLENHGTLSLELKSDPTDGEEGDYE